MRPDSYGTRGRCPPALALSEEARGTHVGHLWGATASWPRVITRRAGRGEWGRVRRFGSFDDSFGPSLGPPTERSVTIGRGGRGGASPSPNFFGRPSRRTSS